MTIKRLLSVLSALLIFAGVFADNGINSPYSRYGLGILADQNLAVNRQMGGIGYALQSNRYINLLNPAAISQVDTLTMMFEAGFSLQNVNFEENGKKINAHNGSFDYIAMEWRVRRGLGMSIGFLPYSNVGYSFSNPGTISGDNSNDQTVTNSYTGSGGIYQPFVGIGWSPFKNFSIGVMGSYIYGDISHTVSSSFSDANISNRTRYYNIDVSSYKLDFGVQYAMQLKDKHSLTLGAVYSLGHSLNADAEVVAVTGSSSSDTTRIDNAFKLPHTFGIGAVYNYNDNWTVGLDYTFQKWGDTDFFGYDKGVNRSKISVGAEYSPNKMTRNIFKAMNYRMGAYYAQPYTQINGKDGCEEFGASIGFSMPVLSSRTLLHVSGQYIHMNPKSAGLISETYLRINIGITFTESWFTKMKVQ